MKHVYVYLIFTRLIFAAQTSGENFLTVKISPSTVMPHCGRKAAKAANREPAGTLSSASQKSGIEESDSWDSDTSTNECASVTPRPLVDSVLATLVALWDRLTARAIKEYILDNFDLVSLKGVKKQLWADKEPFLRGKKKKWTDHRRSTQRLVEEAELDDLVDFINCLDEAESLPPVCVCQRPVDPPYSCDHIHILKSQWVA